MDEPSKNKALYSPELNTLLGEIRLLKGEVEKLMKALYTEKKKDKLLGDWISEKEVIELTGFSRGKLHILWKEGKVAKSTIGEKGNYYLATDFKKLLDKNANR